MSETPPAIPERFQPAYHYIKQLEQYERCHLESSENTWSHVVIRRRLPIEE